MLSVFEVFQASSQGKSGWVFKFCLCEIFFLVKWNWKAAKKESEELFLPRVCRDEVESAFVL